MTNNTTIDGVSRELTEPTHQMAQAGCQAYMAADGMIGIMHHSSMGHAYVAMRALDPEVTALQSTIAQLQARIAELESGRGEVARYDRYYQGAWFEVDARDVARFEKDGWKIRRLYTAPPAPVAVVLPDRELLRDKIAEAIGGDTYDCTRVWAAWGVGTMDQDDFVQLIEQEDRLYEIVDACLDATAALNTPK
ncbi:hypothetical protein ACTJK9_01360 [Pseudomonas sp. 22082]|uniref:hypothetical protein n=1 Tax=Pseudomonas sp. 22082 TaxID=3453868 RepID=UPI003F86C65A